MGAMTRGWGVAGAVAGAIALSSGCSSEVPGSTAEAVGQTSQAVDEICGKAAGATLDGFPAYPWCGNTAVYTDNGIDTRSTGGAGWVETESGYGYQCVEWAVRYFYFKWSVPHTWFIPYAKDMCATHPAGVSQTSNPIHGDLAVIIPGCGGSDATAGHVGAVDTVSSSTIALVQENPAGRYSWPKSCVSCYLHAAANGGSSDPCSTAPSGGFYCGQSPKWGGGTPNDLYDCANGATKSKTVCANGCNLAPAGVNDSYKAAPPDAGGGPLPGDGGSKSDAAPVPASDAGAPGTPDDSGAPVAPDASGEPNVAGGGGDAGAPTDSAGSSGGAGGCTLVPTSAASAPARERTAWWVLPALALASVSRRRRRASDEDGNADNTQPTHVKQAWRRTHVQRQALVVGGPVAVERR